METTVKSSTPTSRKDNASYKDDEICLHQRYMYIADMLYCAFPKYSSMEQSDLEQVNFMKYLPIREQRLKQIQLETERHENHEALKQITVHGRQDNKSGVPPTLVSYNDMRDEPTTRNGLIFKGAEIVIPLGLRAHMKKAVHSSHICIECCFRRPRECLFFWPGIRHQN